MNEADTARAERDARRIAYLERKLGRQKGSARFLMLTFLTIGYATSRWMRMDTGTFLVLLGALMTAFWVMLLRNAWLAKREQRAATDDNFDALVRSADDLSLRGGEMRPGGLHPRRP